MRTFPQNFPRKACGTVRATPGFPPRGAAPLAGEWDTRARASQWSRDECGGLFKAASSRASPARLELQGWLYGDCHSASGAWWGGCASLCSTGEPRSGKKATFPSRDSGPDETRAREPTRPKTYAKVRTRVQMARFGVPPPPFWALPDPHTWYGTVHENSRENGRIS